MVEKSTVLSAVAASVTADIAHNVEKILGRKLDEEEVYNAIAEPIFFMGSTIESIMKYKVEEGNEE